MTRINVTDDDGQYVGHFDNTAKGVRTYYTREWREEKDRIVTTGIITWSYEFLIRTGRGRWVIETLSKREYRHSMEKSYRFVTDHEAESWLIKHGWHKVAQTYFGEDFGERPRSMQLIGGVRLPRILLEWLDEYRSARTEESLSRPEIIRRAVMEYLREHDPGQHICSNCGGLFDCTSKEKCNLQCRDLNYDPVCKECADYVHSGHNHYPGGPIFPWESNQSCAMCSWEN